MAFDVEAAKADGYTDEEIQQYLATKDQPLPPETPRDRTEEQIGTLTSVIPDVVKYGVEGYAFKKLVADPVIGAMQNRGSPTPPTPPTPPTTFTGGANPAFDAALSKPYAAPAAPQPPSNANYMQRMSSLASRYAPVMGKVAAAAGPAAAIGMNLFGTSPEEIATLRAAEERRRQAAMMQQPR
jgi:hypothetical protein